MELNSLIFNFLPIQRKFFWTTGVAEREKYSILELDKPFPLSPISLDFLIGAEKISFNPQNPQKLFFITKATFLKLTTKQKQFQNQFYLT